MKIALSIVLLVYSTCLFGQSDTIRLHFLYGSKPAKGFKKSERKLFGGLKGGHVNIQAGDQVLDFMPGDPCAIFPEHRNPRGGFRLNKAVYWDTAITKWSTVHIPVTPEQLAGLQQLFSSYVKETPYDYAVFGMRCAAASYDVLSDIGLFKKISNKNNIIKHFYPKLLRKRIYKWAQKNNYRITYHQGRNSRKWEMDEGVF